MWISRWDVQIKLRGAVRFHASGLGGGGAGGGRAGRIELGDRVNRVNPNNSDFQGVMI